VGWAVSLVLPIHSPEERSGVRPRWRPYNFIQTTSQPQGATWQPMTGPRGTSTTNRRNAKCRMLTRPHISHVPYHLSPYLPSHPADVIPATSVCATCHPYSGDTCHPLTGPTVPVVCHNTYHMSSPGAATSAIQSTCHMALYGLYSHPLFFACFGFRTERDIFRI
jgi:hypothetical protein